MNRLEKELKAIGDENSGLIQKYNRQLAKIDEHFDKKNQTNDDTVGLSHTVSFASTTL